MKLLWSAVPVVLVLVSGCGKDARLPGSGDEDTGTGISFSSPDDGDEILSSSVRVKVRTQGITLVPEAIGGEPVDGQGHYHFYVDGGAAGESAGDDFLVTDLSTGTHEITARLFQNDHQPVIGASPASVKVEIPPDAPRVRVVSPAAGSLIQSSSVELTVEWDNYTSGRWHAYVDEIAGDPHGVAADPTSVVTRLSPGRHVVYVRLHHSGGDPFEPEVVDAVPVEIPDGVPTVRIVEPGYGSEVPRNTPIRVEVENFDLDGDSAGGDNADRQGHYHVYIGGYDSGHMWQEGYWPETTISSAPLGTRQIYVRLMNNDHTSIEPKIVDRIEVNVAD